MVLAELWRGATVALERQFVRGNSREPSDPVPTTSDWLESGQILAKIRDDKGFEPHKIRDSAFRRPDRADRPLPWCTAHHVEPRGLRPYPGLFAIFKLEVW